MPDNSLALTGGLFPANLDRQVSKALAKIEASTTVATRRDMARLERISSTTAHGMMAISHLASIEGALTQATPHAADRIQAAGCAGAIGIVGVIHDAGRGA